MIVTIMKYDCYAIDDQHFNIQYLKGSWHVFLPFKYFLMETTIGKVRLMKSINYAINSVTAYFIEINPT